VTAFEDPASFIHSVKNLDTWGTRPRNLHRVGPPSDLRPYCLGYSGEARRRALY